jgi:very-short-patch-repair endonuclease
MRHPHSNARKLRKALPPAEQRLWHFVRRKQLGGFRFRRQHTIGDYIVDFACLEAGIVIELDGSQHGEDGAIFKDKERDLKLSEAGYDVIRIWNYEVMENIEGVLEGILERCENSIRAKNHQR